MQFGDKHRTPAASAPFKLARACLQKGTIIIPRHLKMLAVWAARGEERKNKPFAHPPQPHTPPSYLPFSHKRREEQGRAQQRPALSW